MLFIEKIRNIRLTSTARLIAWVFLFCHPYYLFSQQPFFKNYSVDNGLPSSNVYYAFQDSKGYMWFSTDAGISRYDGYDFVNYTTEDGLSDNEVFQIKEDSKGRLWFLTLNGCLSYYDDGKFHNPKNDSILSNACFTQLILSFLEDADSNIFIGASKEGIVRIGNGGARRVTLRGWTFFFWEQNTKLYALTSTGILEFSKDLNEMKVVNKEALSHVYRAIDFNGDIFFGRSKTLHKVNDDFSIETLYEFDILEGSISAIYKQNNGRFWVGTKDGVFVQNVEQKELAFTKYLEGRTITSILEDREGNIWISTLERGVYFISSTNIFSYEESPIGEGKVKTLSRGHENSLWVGGEKNQYYQIKSGGKRVERYRIKGITGEPISKIRYFSNNDLWVIGKENILRVKDGNHSYFNYWGNDVCMDKGNNLWLVLSVIVKIPEKQWKSTLVKNPNSTTNRVRSEDPVIKENILAKRRCNVIEKDVRNNIWLGMEQGLFTWTNNQLINEKSFPTDVSGRITDIDYSGKLDLLVATSSASGIAIFKKGQFQEIISKKEGLSSNISNCVKIDPKQKRVWIATAKGLDMLILDGDEVVVINDNRFKNIKINDIETVNNRVYLGTDRGLLFFNHQENQIDSLVPPKIYINDLMVRGIPIERTTNVELSYDQNDITIEFVGLYYQNHGKIKYKYSLSANEGAWNETDAKKVDFKSLNPGNYKFRVKALSDLGIESKEVASISFTIKPPYWKTWWFTLLVFLGVSGIVLIFWQIRLREIKKRFKVENEKLEIEKSLAEIEQKALRLQMNPHFIFNVINSVKGDYAENNIQRANNYLVKFSKFLRLVLENSDQFISLEKEVTMLTLYMELTQIRYEDKFTYEFRVDDEINMFETSIPSMMLQPFIENAIIHGIVPKKGEGKIIINFTKVEQDMLLCKIEDNGIGRSASGENVRKDHKSQAIKITQERLDLIAQQTGKECRLNIIDKTSGNMAIGTDIEVIIPFLHI